MRPQGLFDCSHHFKYIIQRPYGFLLSGSEIWVQWSLHLMPQYCERRERRHNKNVRESKDCSLHEVQSHGNPTPRATGQRISAATSTRTRRDSGATDRTCSSISPTRFLRDSRGQNLSWSSPESRRSSEATTIFVRVPRLGTKNTQHLRRL
jgi:hypothetical protein